MTFPAKVVAPGEARKLGVVGDTVEVTLAGADTGGAYAAIIETTPPGGGPPPHCHRREDETFFVLEGEVEFTIAGRSLRASAGTTLFGPRGIPHAFRNVGARESRVLIVISPPGLEKFFDEVDGLPPERLLALAPKYGLEIQPP